MLILSELPMRIPFLSWVFLTLTCSFFISFCLFAVSGKCLVNEQSLLLQLKNDLIFDHDKSTKLAQWNGSVDCCLWKGITCLEGRVIGLDLTNESISGGLNSSSLFNLQCLQNLSLAHNYFYASQIPSKFDKLENLIYLNLSSAGFVGQVPIAISHLTRLVILDLSINIYSLEATSLKLENPNLDKLIQNLSELVELHLDGVNIFANGKEWCQALSSSVPKLRVLSLSSCNLLGPIHPSILLLKSISTICLNNNIFSTPMPEFFSNFTNLTSLYLSHSRLFGIFPQKIFQIPTIEVLDLSYNELLQGSLPKFSYNGSLQTLMLSSTNFSGPLPSSLGSLKMLSVIDISFCNFHGSIPNSMGSLTQLVSLDMSNNKLIGSIPSFNMTRSLIEINLSQNNLSGPITSTHWQELSHLVGINLCNNSLNGRIPFSFFSHPSLQKIQLSNNQFSGQLEEIAKVSSVMLDIVDLSSNKLSGPIPNFVFEQQGLKKLSLSFNNFNGSLQLEVIQKLRYLSSIELSYNSLWIGYNGTTLSSSSFPQLTTLRLASCKLRKFPYFLINQSKLSNLDLSVNQIDGSIPSWISKLGDLQYLNLSFNHLTTLEGSFSNLSSLSTLDLHFNQLQGEFPILPPYATILDFSMNNFHSTLPFVIGNSLDLVNFFSLSSNDFHGHIPESICNATSVEVLDLSNNSFHGSIPQCLIEMSENLGVLNLRRNNINESIPDFFPENCSLQTLDLNGNQLEGLLPRSLVNCENLEVLNVGNNLIKDTFPCYLRNASMLRVLILRSNKFYGDIGCSKLNITWPMLQIVDGASNKFIGEIPKILNWKPMMGDAKVAKSELSHLQFQFLQLSALYYQDSVIIIAKGLDMELKKILSIFTLFDFSCNILNGPIPEEIGELKFLHVLNLSHNGFIGQIPPSLGKLSYLESLDLSCNNITGEIPQQLADGLIFLSFLNLSFNQLVGQIPSIKQFSTFSETSFEGNKRLCGFPLKVECKDLGSQLTTQDRALTKPTGFNGLFISTGLGFLVGAAWNVGLLMLWETGRRWCDETVHKILLVVLPLWDCLRQKMEHEEF